MMPGSHMAPTALSTRGFFLPEIYSISNHRSLLVNGH
jgi:hypothetical protein